MHGESLLATDPLLARPVVDVDEEACCKELGWREAGVVRVQAARLPVLV